MICDRCRRAVHPRRAEGWARVYASNVVGEDRYEVTELAWLCETCAEAHRAWLMGGGGDGRADAADDRDVHPGGA